MRVLSYCIMPNHWHLVLYPREDRDLSEFMRWVTTTHVRQRRTQTKTIGHGHLYQGPFKSFAVQEDKRLVDVIRYVEQNPLRAKLVKKAQDWQWSSLFTRIHSKKSKLIDALPTHLPHNYISSVNDLLTSEKLERIHQSIAKRVPYGSLEWGYTKVGQDLFQRMLRNPGRQKKIRI